MGEQVKRHIATVCISRPDLAEKCSPKGCTVTDVVTAPVVLATDHDRVVAELRAELERLSGIVSHVRMQASIQAQEARTQKSIVTEIGAMVGCEEDWLTAGAVRAALDAKEQGEWIACAERLPEADGPYWCWFGKEEPSVIQQRVCIFIERQQQFSDYAVTHWRPLPAAPSSQD